MKSGQCVRCTKDFIYLYYYNLHNTVKIIFVFYFQTEQKVIDLDLLREIYHKNKSIFDKESFKILVNNKYHIPLNEMFAQSATEGNNLYVWCVTIVINC